VPAQQQLQLQLRQQPAGVASVCWRAQLRVAPAPARAESQWPPRPRKQVYPVHTSAQEELQRLQCYWSG